MLARAALTHVAGFTAGVSRADVLVTHQGDGVVLRAAGAGRSEDRAASWPLGAGPAARFLAPAVHDAATGRLFAAVAASGDDDSSARLACWRPGAQHAAARLCSADVAHCELPAPPVALYCARAPDAGAADEGAADADAAEGVVLVFPDGAVAAATVPGAAEVARGGMELDAGCDDEVALTWAEERAGGGRVVACAAPRALNNGGGAEVAIVEAAPGGGYAVTVFELHGGSVEAVLGPAALEVPATAVGVATTPVAAALTDEGLMVAWSSGALIQYRLRQGTASLAFHREATDVFGLAPFASAPVVGAEAAAPTPARRRGGSKKRRGGKQPEAPGGSGGPGEGASWRGHGCVARIAPSLVCVAGAAAGENATAGELRLVAVDTRFGCAHAEHSLQLVKATSELSSVDVEAAARAAPSKVRLSTGSGEGEALVCSPEASAVLSVRLPAPDKVDLASALGALPSGGRGVPPRSVSLTPVWAPAATAADARREAPRTPARTSASGASIAAPLVELDGDEVWEGESMARADALEKEALEKLLDVGETPDIESFGAVFYPFVLRHFPKHGEGESEGGDGGKAAAERVAALRRRGQVPALSAHFASRCARRCLTSRLWQPLELLLSTGHVLSADADCPGLFAALVEAAHPGLLEAALLHVREVSQADLTMLIGLFLGADTEGSSSAMAEAMAGAAAKRLQKVEALIAAVERRKGRAFMSREEARTASIAAAAVERFSDGEQCLHALVAAPRDRAVAREALSALSGSQAEAMLSYLAKWLTAYGDVPALARCAPHKRPLPRVPSLSRCIEWAGHVIDSHFAALALQLRIKGGGGGAGSASAVDTLRGLQGFVAEQVKAGRLSAPLPGALVHAQRAPRDAAADVAGSCPLYSVEVLEAPR